MGWSITEPAGSQSLNAGDDIIRDNYTALQDAISGTHVFPGTSGVGGTRGAHRPGLTPTCAINTQAVISAYTDIQGAISFPTDLSYLWTNNGSSWDCRGTIISGTVMLFFQAAAPLGWTLLTTIHDELAYVASGAAGAGHTGGTWTISGMTYNHRHVYTSTVYHRHSITGKVSGTTGSHPRKSQSTSVTAYTNYAGTSTCYTAYTSGGLTSDGTWRPKAVSCMLATKD